MLRRLSSRRLFVPFLPRRIPQAAHGSSRRTFGQSPGKHASETTSAVTRYPEPGAVLHGFRLRRIQHVPELQLTAVQLEHDKTGAEYLHVDREDDNNVFSIGFKTNPPDDTGVPHILEHTTLCGSKKYPIRDPFFNMLPRSLANFMNAFTAADHTTYPFATTNRQDFKNLMSVYLDATLQPLLKSTDYAQEGWRLGPQARDALQDAQQSTSDRQVEFKGVVYNEMKGQMSDASYLFYTRYQDHIFPDIHNSGGDPQNMTDLTYNQLHQFHVDHYHPSNAKVFSYGNMPLVDHLIEVNKQFEAFDRKKADADIKTPIRLDQPQTVTVQGPVDPLVDKNMQYKVSTSWMLGDASDVQETFALNVLSSLLLNGYGSPLYQALIESGLGPEFSPNTGLDSAGKTGIFCVGLSGVKAEDVEGVKEATDRALKAAYDRGFDDQKVQGLLHQLELGLKHKTPSFGIDVMHRLQPGWFNGTNPFDALAWSKTVSTFKELYGKGDYLEGLLGKYLLTDRAFTFIMQPSETFGQDLAGEEKTRLSRKMDELSLDMGVSNTELEALVSSEEEYLREEQKASKDQDLTCLPQVHVSDIPRTAEKKAVHDTNIDTVTVQWRETSTNGLTYFRALHSWDDLPRDLLRLVPLFCDAIFRLGTKTKPVEELEDLIKLRTGGIRVSYFSSASALDPQAFTQGLSFSGHALDENVPAMYDLLCQVLWETDFDAPEAQARLRELINADASGALNAVANDGHAYCRRFAQAGLSPAATLSEQVAGLTQVRYIASLAAGGAESDLDAVTEKLKIIQDHALSKSKDLRVAITCGPDAVAGNERALQRFLDRMPQPGRIVHPGRRPGGADRPAGDDYARRPRAFFPLPYQVYHTGVALPTPGFLDPASAPLQVLAQLLTHKRLLPEVREKGGAYGAGATASGLGGTFGFYSYRDPDPRHTLRVVRGLGTWLASQRWGGAELAQAQLGVFQGLDAPQGVADEGMTRFLLGVSEDMEQQRRERLLDVTIEEVLGAAEKYVLPGLENARTAVMGPQSAWASAEDGWAVEDLQAPSKD